MTVINAKRILSFWTDPSNSVPAYIPDSAWSGVAPGVWGQSGPVSESPAGGTLHLNLLLDTLGSMMPSMSAQDAQAAVTHALNELQLQESSNSEMSEQAQQQLQQQMMREAAQLAQQAEEKMQEAQQANAGLSIWDKIKLAFQMFAAAVSVVIGSVLVVTGVGATLGALMIGAGLVGLAQAVNSIVESCTGAGIMGDFVRACGGSATVATDFDLACTIACSIYAIGLAVLTLGSNVAEDISAAAELATTVSDAVNGATAAATGVGSVVAAYVSYDATNEQAESQKDSARQQQDQAMVDCITQVIKELAQQAAEVLKAIAAQFSSEMQIAGQTGKTIVDVKFVA